MIAVKLKRRLEISMKLTVLILYPQGFYNRYLGFVAGALWFKGLLVGFCVLMKTRDQLAKLPRKALRLLVVDANYVLRRHETVTTHYVRTF